MTPLQRLLADAVEAHITPGAVLEFGSSTGPEQLITAGRLTYQPQARRVTAGTWFDLASLTKVVATTTMAMRLVEARRLTLDMPVHQYVPSWRGRDRAAVTVRDLLTHASGLPAWAPLFRTHTSLTGMVDAVARLPLDYPPRSRSEYSDLGFIVLGAVLERAGGAGLRDQFDSVARAALGPQPLSFTPTPGATVAPTEQDPWRDRLLVGEVHDENASALGGVAGHAGLFGTAPAVGSFARWLLRLWHAPAATAGGITSKTVRLFLERAGIPGSSRALGWDTMLPTSSCGTRLSATAVGHTGFTGTSLWIDRVRDLYVVLLTNRVYPSREGEGIQDLRRAVHDAVVDVIERDRLR